MNDERFKFRKILEVATYLIQNFDKMAAKYLIKVYPHFFLNCVNVKSYSQTCQKDSSEWKG